VSRQAIELRKNSGGKRTVQKHQNLNVIINDFAMKKTGKGTVKVSLKLKLNLIIR
jgi:hypothetical protein